MLKNFVQKFLKRRREYMIPKVGKAVGGLPGPGSYQAGRRESMRTATGRMSPEVAEGLERGKIK